MAREFFGEIQSKGDRLAYKIDEIFDYSNNKEIKKLNLIYVKGDSFLGNEGKVYYLISDKGEIVPFNLAKDVKLDYISKKHMGCSEISYHSINDEYGILNASLHDKKYMSLIDGSGNLIAELSNYDSITVINDKGYFSGYSKERKGYNDIYKVVDGEMKFLYSIIPTNRYFYIPNNSEIEDFGKFVFIGGLLFFNDNTKLSFLFKKDEFIIDNNNSIVYGVGEVDYREYFECVIIGFNGENPKIIKREINEREKNSSLVFIEDIMKSDTEKKGKKHKEFYFDDEKTLVTINQNRNMDVLRDIIDTKDVDDVKLFKTSDDKVYRLDCDNGCFIQLSDKISYEDISDCRLAGKKIESSSPFYLYFIKKGDFSCLITEDGNVIEPSVVNANEYISKGFEVKVNIHGVDFIKEIKEVANNYRYRYLHIEKEFQTHISYVSHEGTRVIDYQYKTLSHIDYSQYKEKKVTHLYDVDRNIELLPPIYSWVITKYCPDGYAIVINEGKTFIIEDGKHFEIEKRSYGVYDLKNNLPIIEPDEVDENGYFLEFPKNLNLMVDKKEDGTYSFEVFGDSDLLQASSLYYNVKNPRNVEDLQAMLYLQSIGEYGEHKSRKLIK